MKRHNQQLSVRCREEVKLKLKEHEARSGAEDKVKTLSGRLSFLLNKLQADEEMRVVQKEEVKKMEAQLRSMQERTQDSDTKLSATGESNRIMSNALRLKQQELDEVQAKYEALKVRARPRD